MFDTLRSFQDMLDYENLVFRQFSFVERQMKL